MKKYCMLFGSCLKQSLTYRADALTGAALSFFSVLIAYLLWSLLIPQGGELGGFTLPAMVTYTMIGTALSPFVQSSATMLAFADEIRTGKYARYLYTPISPFGAFASQSLAAALPGSLFTALCCLLWSLVFHRLMQPLSLTGTLCALPVLALSAAFVLLLNHLIVSLAFRFTDVLGVVLIRGTLLSLFSGGLAPLEVLFGGAPLWSPLYYLIGYPAQLMMGRPVASPWLACAALGAWTLLLAALTALTLRRSRAAFEGVGA
ncbi:MAG: ABC-2 family transporter protein [Eubacteriales bacterium]|nr:ABC-2 family transporter protein [Eubacteriales bacterium]